MNNEKMVEPVEAVKLKAKAAKIPLEQLHPFEGHPYKVQDNKEMEALTESIREWYFVPTYCTTFGKQGR